MKRKTANLIMILVVLAVTGIVMNKTGAIFTSHAAAVDATIESLLVDRGPYLPRETADLSLLAPGSMATAARVADWHTEFARLENTRPILVSFLDDDPIYRLKASLRVVYDDGSESLVSWESWRYGLVLGPLVVSLGNGPPGYITSVASVDGG